MKYAIRHKFSRRFRGHGGEHTTQLRFAIKASETMVTRFMLSQLPKGEYEVIPVFATPSGEYVEAR